MIVRQGQHVGRIELRIELAGDERRIRCAEPEGDQGRGIAKNGVTDIRIQLMEILVCQGHAHFVFTQLGKHVGQRQRGERLELIDIKPMSPAVMLGNIGAAERRQPDGGDQEPTQERGAILAEFSFGEIDQQDLALIHQFPNVDGLPRRREHAAQGWITEKGRDLALNRRNGLGGKPGIFWKLQEPEVANLLVPAIPDGVFTEGFVAE